MFIVGPVEPHEVDEVVRIAARSLQERVPPTWIAAAAAKDPENVLVAREVPSNRVVGFALSSRSEPCQGTLLALAVDGTHQGLGIGSALVGAVRDHLVRKGAMRLDLQVRADDERAKGFYRRHGFSPEGLERHAYSDGADAIHLARPI